MDTFKLITPEQIEEVKNRLIAAYNPKQIYLFGSYAWGTPHVDSDLDLMVVVDKFEPVVTEDGEVYRPSFAGKMALFGMFFPKDLVVLTENEFAEKSAVQGKLAYAVKHYGKLLYASMENNEPFVDASGFNFRNAQAAKNR